jgi:hypothetical protein
LIDIIVNIIININFINLNYLTYLTFARNPWRSRLSLQERELEPGDNIFIIHLKSNYNYENFTIRSYQVESGQLSGHLVSDHFGSWVGYRVI